jgi:hypothetical protein
MAGAWYRQRPGGAASKLEDGRFRRAVREPISAWRSQIHTRLFGEVLNS